MVTTDARTNFISDLVSLDAFIFISLDILSCVEIKFLYPWIFLHLRKRDFNADGKLSDPATLLKEHNYEIGQYVRRKRDKVLGQIQDVHGEKVTLSMEDGPITGMAHVAISSFIKGEWKVVPAPNTVEMVDFRHITSQSSSEARCQIMRGEIQKKLVDLEAQH